MPARARAARFAAGRVPRSIPVIATISRSISARFASDHAAPSATASARTGVA